MLSNNIVIISQSIPWIVFLLFVFQPVGMSLSFSRWFVKIGHVFYLLSEAGIAADQFLLHNTPLSCQAPPSAAIAISVFQARHVYRDCLYQPARSIRRFTVAASSGFMKPNLDLRFCSKICTNFPSKITNRLLHLPAN